MPTTVTSRRTHDVILLADRACDAAALRPVTDAVRGLRVRVVAPAGAVAGERWIVDVSTRRSDALRRLRTWTAALAPHAASVDGEVGDESPRLAVADARREIGDAPMLTIGTPATSPRRAHPAARRVRRSARGLVPRSLPA